MKEIKNMSTSSLWV